MKNLVIRQFFAIALIVVISFIYFNCGDDAATNSATTSGISCITGQLANWTFGSSKTLKFSIYSKSNHIYPIANCPIDSFGNFKLCLPSTLSDTTMFRADSVFYSGCPGNATVNPPDTRGAEIWRMNVYSSDNSPFGYIKRCNYDGTPVPGSFYALYIYVNKDLTVTGNKYCAPDSLRFDGSAVTGWNQITVTYLKAGPGGNSVLYNNTEPAGAIWKFHP